MQEKKCCFELLTFYEIEVEVEVEDEVEVEK